MAIEQAAAQRNLRDPRIRRRDIRAFLWLCGWGGAAMLALIVFVLTSQTKSAGDRLRLIFATREPSAVAQMPPRVTQLEIETQFLTKQIRTLAADRDRLAGRVALLESSLDDMTGAIKKQAAATAALAAKTTPTSAPASSPTATGSTTSTPAAITRQAPTTTSAASTNMHSSAASDLTAASTEAVPLPPGRATAALASEPETSLANPETLPANPVEFGLDLGGAATVDGVRQRWISVKANFGPLLSGMYPLAAHERRAGSTGYRLVVGPLPNSAAASGLCAHFTAARTACRSAKFDGEQIVQR